MIFRVRLSERARLCFPTLPLPYPYGGRRRRFSLRCRRRGPGWVTTAALAALAGCAALTQDLDRAEAHYDRARYEEALVWLDRLERQLPRMTLPDRARFHFLRGMSAHRLGRRDQARHELGLARELAGDPEVSLGERRERLLRRALDELS